MASQGSQVSAPQSMPLASAAGASPAPPFKAAPPMTAAPMSAIPMVAQVSDLVQTATQQMAKGASPFIVTSASGAALPSPIPVQASAEHAVDSGRQRAQEAESGKRRRVGEHHALPDSARLIAARDLLFKAQNALQRLNNSLIMSVTSASFTNTGRDVLESAMVRTERLSKVFPVTEIHDWLTECIHFCMFFWQKKSLL